MSYWAHINGIDYPIAEGWTLTDEFSETLDTASIILPHVVGTIEIKPFDDVIIHDFGKNQLPPRPYGVIIKTDGSEPTAGFEGHFYRHMLIYSFNKERLTVDEMDGVGQFVHNYNIQLVSETIGLEHVQLPNRTITQPIGTGYGIEGEPEYANVSFVIGDTTPVKMTYPYVSTVNSVNDAPIVMWGTTVSVLEQQRYDWKQFAGDMDSSTQDFSRFTQIGADVVNGAEIILPDWNVSGITLYYIRKNAFGVTAEEWYQTFHPEKIWIVRRVKNADGTPTPQQGNWGTRAEVLETIQSYLDEENPASYSEIINESLFGGIRKVSSTDEISSIPVVFDTDGSYQIYLYIAPRKFGYGPHGGDSASLNRVNMYGMTDNTHGYRSIFDGSQTPPDVSVPFLAKWSFNVVSEETLSTKGILTVYEATRQALELYSPYIKVATEDVEFEGEWYKNWEWRRKYSISENFKNEFINVIAPENQFSNPNLRDYLSRLCNVADCIPVVHDNVITFMSLSQRDPKPFSIKDGCRGSENYMMDGSSYCDRLLRTYNDGLSKDNVVHCVDRLGFKNMDSPTMTLENMRLELTHPVYSIEKVYLCYYNTIKVGPNGEDKMYLCKQDITPLVLLNSKRSLLSREWNHIEVHNGTPFMVSAEPRSIQELAQYYYATVGYDIGSRYITGWGTQYSHPVNVFWNTKRTTLENIFMFVRSKTPYGDPYQLAKIADNFLVDSEAKTNASEDRTYIDDNDQAQLLTTNDIGTYSGYWGSFTQRMKSLMFIVEYNGFISSSVIASKDDHDGNVVSRDNASSSLSFLESDGNNQKTKVNRLGNATRTLSARYANLADIQSVSQVWDDGSEHQDEVMFKRTITFEHNHFQAAYWFCKSYTLKDYFTSVFSRHRPFALSSYGESVERLENRTLQILFSGDAWYHQDETNRVAFKDIEKLLSFYTPSTYDGNGNVVLEEGISHSYYTVYPSDEFQYAGQFGIFATDMQKFTSGNSLCFAVAMKDSVSAGTYVADFNNNLGKFIGATIYATVSSMFNNWTQSNDAIDTNVLLKGSRQDWYMFPVDPRNGMLYQMSFGVGYVETDTLGIYDAVGYSFYDISEAQLLPLLDVQLLRANANDKIYFGQYVDFSGTDKAVGAGYPQLSFVIDNQYGLFSDEFYHVEASDPKLELTESQAVIKGEIDSFADSQGHDVPDRQLITEFASAIFNGSEKEGSPANDMCVFKDNKERITTTIQFEPVCEDGKIAFSPLMMKLSDAMGGKEKNYSTVEIENRIAFKFGVANIQLTSMQYEDSSGDGDYELYQYQILASLPSITIGFLNNKIKVGEFNGPEDPFEITYTVSGVEHTYSLKINKINVSLVNENYNVTANCLIKYDNDVITESNIQFTDITNVSITDVVECRNGDSKVSAYYSCFRHSAAYRSFAMVDDWVLQGNPLYPQTHIKIDYSKYPENKLVFHDYVDTWNSIGYKTIRRLPNQPITPIPFTDSPADLSNIDHTDFTIFQEQAQHDSVNTSDQSQQLNSSSVINIVEYGEKLDGSITKEKNMYWVFSSEKLGKETPYQTFESLEKFTDLQSLGFDPTTDILVGYGRLRMRYLSIKLPFNTTIGSIRLYYLEDNKYSFVFGMNVCGINESDPQCLTPFQTIDEKPWFRILVSSLDDRSKTVIDDVAGSRTRGDPVYKTLNFYELDMEVAPTNRPINLAVDKNQS